MLGFRYAHLGAISLCLISNSALASDWNYRIDNAFNVTSFKTKFNASTGFLILDNSVSNSFQIYNKTTLNASKQFDAASVNFNLSTGAVYARGDFINKLYYLGHPSGYIADLTDTQAAISVSLTNLNKFKPYFSVGLNLPTGHNAFRGDCEFVVSSFVCAEENDEKHAYFDSNTYLVPITSYGEGLNLNAGLGFSYAFNNKFNFSLGGSYDYRGDYISSEQRNGVDASHIYPGNILKGRAQISYQSGNFALSPYVEYTNVTNTINDKLDYNGYYTERKSADRIKAGFNTSIGFGQGHTSSLSFSYSHSLDDDLQIDRDPIFTDTYRYKLPNEYTIGLSHNYQINEKWSVNGKFDYNYIVPKATSFAKGLFGDDAFFNHTEVGVGASYQTESKMKYSLNVNAFKQVSGVQSTTTGYKSAFKVSASF